MEETISMKDLFLTIRKRAILIVSIMLICAVATGIVSYKYITPTYQASSQLLVNDLIDKNSKKKEDETSFSAAQLQLNLQLINTYLVIIQSPNILSKVIEDLKLDMSVDELQNILEVENAEGSQVVNITVTESSSEEAVLIVNQIAKVFQTEVKEFYDINNVTILAEAKVSPNQETMNSQPIVNIMIALVVGLIIGLGLSLILDYFDSTIKDKQDLVSALDLPILGEVPPIKYKKKISERKKVNTQYRGETLGS